MSARPSLGLAARVLSFGILGLMATSACTPQSSQGQSSGGVTVTPGEGVHADTPEGRGEGDSRDELEQRMRDLVGKQQDMSERASADAGVCEDICSLATSICGVQEKLCVIADDHPGDADYQGLCREAKQECKSAQDECIRCVERHAAGGSPAGTP